MTRGITEDMERHSMMIVFVLKGTAVGNGFPMTFFPAIFTLTRRGMNQHQVTETLYSTVDVRPILYLCSFFFLTIPTASKFTDKLLKQKKKKY